MSLVDSTGAPASVSASFTPTTYSAAVTQLLFTVTTTSQVILAANASRKIGWVRNISDADIYVSLSGTAATTLPHKVKPDASLNLGNSSGVYTGAVSAITAVGTKSLEVFAA